MSFTFKKSFVLPNRKIMTQNAHNDLTLDILKRFSSHFVRGCRPRCRNIKFILMVSRKKLLLSTNVLVLTQKMMHPHMTGSILEIIILLHQSDKIWKEIMLIVLIALPQLYQLIQNSIVANGYQPHEKYVIYIFRKKTCALYG